MESCAAFTLTPAICAHGEIGHGGGRCGKAERGAWTELGHVCHATCVEVHVFGKFEIKPRWIQIVATTTTSQPPRSLLTLARSHIAHSRLVSLCTTVWLHTVCTSVTLSCDEAARCGVARYLSCFNFAHPSSLLFEPRLKALLSVLQRRLRFSGEFR